MYWQEKIDRLKSEFSQSDFRDPFTDWPDILKNVESNFIIRQDSLYHFTNWSENIKQQHVLRTISRQDVQKEIGKLDAVANYWVVITGDPPTSRNMVYDCKPKSLNVIISMAGGNFYIIDKKYRWFTFFNVHDDKITIVKSGSANTPFDN